MWWALCCEANTDAATAALKPFQCAICREHKWSLKGMNAFKVAAHIAGDLPTREPGLKRRTQRGVTFMFELRAIRRKAMRET